MNGDLTRKHSYLPVEVMLHSRSITGVRVVYGKKFSLAGNKQIGRKMLDDLEDGVAYAKTLGFIDENRVAIYGGSYGGLATLGSLVKTPDLYAAVWIM